MAKPLHILVVDDCKAARLRISELLAPYGGCDQADGGYAGYGLFCDGLKGAKPFDLVIVDVMMPDLDGPGAVRLMREAERDLDTVPTPVLMLSSIQDGRVMLATQYEAGADAYLTKPLDPPTLQEALFNLGLIAAPARVR